METGIEPVCTALQAVASPLGHSTAGIDATCTFERMTGFEPATLTLARGCATNCATSARNGRDRRPVAKDDDSPRERAHTNLFIRCRFRLAGAREARGTFCDVRLVLVFDVVRLSTPVPWLSGRASASHAEGRWFDPSRDHFETVQVRCIFL